jgi:hypothetical protein
MNRAGPQRQKKILFVQTLVDIQSTNLHDITSQNTKILIENSLITSNLSSSKNQNTHVEVRVSLRHTIRERNEE